MPSKSGIVARTSGRLLSLGNLRFVGPIRSELFRKRICSQLFCGPDRVSQRPKKPLQRDMFFKSGTMHGSPSSLGRSEIGETLCLLLRFALTNLGRLGIGETLY